MTAFRQNNNWWEAGLAFFYPPVCQLCGEQRARSDEGYVCPQCRLRVRFIRPPYCERCGLPYPGDLTTPFECTNCREMELHFKFARSAVAAQGVVLEAIHRYKYQQAHWFEPFLADLLVREAAPEMRRGNWNLIVPVPLHPRKQRERGFNQAGRLAEHLSTATNIPLNQSCLRRVLFTGTQTLLTRQERAANMRRAFATKPMLRLNGKHIVLVDDVFTTGATASACAKALLAARADEVCVWTAARGL
jgi:competence protein ComFC